MAAAPAITVPLLLWDTQAQTPACTPEQVEAREVLTREVLTHSSASSSSTTLAQGPTVRSDLWAPPALGTRHRLGNGILYKIFRPRADLHRSQITQTPEVLQEVLTRAGGPLGRTQNSATCWHGRTRQGRRALPRQSILYSYTVYAISRRVARLCDGCERRLKVDFKDACTLSEESLVTCAIGIQMLCVLLLDGPISHSCIFSVRHTCPGEVFFFFFAKTKYGSTAASASSLLELREKHARRLSLAQRELALGLAQREICAATRPGNPFKKTYLLRRPL